MTIVEQSALWLEQLAARRRRPVKPSTIATYTYLLNGWVLPRMGTMQLSEVTNSTLKDLVAVMSRHRLSPVTIQNTVRVAREVIRSDRDPVTGARLHNLDFDPEFCDLPVTDRTKQRSPVVSSEDLKRVILDAGGQYRALYALLGGTGLRISEALAIRVGEMATVTYWDPAGACIHVLTALYRGEDQSPKSASGTREVDLPQELNKFLIGEALALDRKHKQLFFQSVDGGPGKIQSLRDVINVAKIPGFHSFRRFRATWLRQQQAPEDLIRYWLGHSSSNITDRYSKLAQRVDVRREWIEKIGLGFQLPEGK